MGAIAYLWDKLIPGAGVLLDDCAYSESLRNQKRAAEAKPGGAAQIARRRLVSLADERDRPLLTDPWYACAMSVSRLLITFGVVLVAVGLLWPLIGKLGIGRLPGDIVIERENFRLYIPLATSLLISLLLSLILWLLNR